MWSARFWMMTSQIQPLALRHPFDNVDQHNVSISRQSSEPQWHTYKPTIFFAHVICLKH